MYRILANNVPEAWEEFKWTFYGEAVEENSRNGAVWTVPAPMILEIHNPVQRVMFDPVRDCNPFFHVMEFVWMMAGSKDLAWISHFNKQLGAYSDDKTTLPASYGYRWREFFGLDQLVAIARQLLSDSTTRRAVLGMWDPRSDLGGGDPNTGLDKPCNTQIYFRVVDGCLDMLVTNRSNDAVWGMFGANAVHMTMLHELMALATGHDVGVYRVLTNNLHVYKNLPNVGKITAKHQTPGDYYRTMNLVHFPLLHEGETLEEFLEDARWFVSGTAAFTTKWFQNVAKPMRDAYVYKENRQQIVTRIHAQDWRVAATQWAERHV